MQNHSPPKKKKFNKKKFKIPKIIAQPKPKPNIYEPHQNYREEDAISEKPSNHEKEISDRQSSGRNDSFERIGVERTPSYEIPTEKKKVTNGPNYTIPKFVPIKQFKIDLQTIDSVRSDDKDLGSFTGRSTERAIKMNRKSG